MRLQSLLGAVCAAATLCAASLASAVIPQSEQATAEEFYHAALDHYFITANDAEKEDLRSGKHPGWTATGYKFAVIRAGSSYEGSAPICRFYSQTLDSHFYSANAAECADVKAKFPDVWQHEADEVYRAFPVNPSTGQCPADTTATYRLYNKRADANHRYTDQLAAYVYMLGKGYQPEGDGNPSLPVVFCTPAGGDTVPPAAEAAPSCTVTASSGAPALGDNLALSATCTNSPILYYWTNCNSVTDKCTTTKSTSGSVPYTLYAVNAVGPADPVTVNVNWGGGGGGGGAVPVCQLVGNNANPAIGSNLTLTANCSQTPTSYDWVECSYLQQSVCNAIPACASTSKTCTVTTSVSGFHRYMVAGTNSAGKGTRAPLDIEWLGGSNPNPGNPGNPVSVPVCTIFSSDINPTAGTSINLTASCTNGPTGYVWGGAGTSGCSTTYYRCTVTAAAAGPITYSVAGRNSGGTGGTVYVDVTWKTSTVDYPVCSLTPSNASPFTGSEITLTATCTKVTAGQSTYTWTGCTPAANTDATCKVTESAAGGKVYKVTATNTVGTSLEAQAAVTWYAPVPPSCTLAASPTSPTVGTNVTITATCANSPSSYVWTGCTSTTSSCTDNVAAVGLKTYTLAATNQFGTDTKTIDVNWIAAPALPPVCTITPSATSLTVGQSLTLTANCVNFPTSFQWTNCTQANPTATSCTTTATAAGPVTYTVVAQNQYGFSNGAQTTVNWTTQTTSQDFCGQYGGVIETDMAWGDTKTRYFTSSIGGFYGNVIWLLRVTVPTSESARPNDGLMQPAEYQGSPAMRTMTLSSSRCDFRSKDETGANGPLAAAGGTTPAISFNVGGTRGASSLQPGKTYYFAVRNENCGSGACNMSVTGLWPR